MVVDRMAAQRTGTGEILAGDTASRYPAQAFGEDGQTSLDHRTGLPGVKNRSWGWDTLKAVTGADSTITPLCVLHLWVPGSRAEPFFPLCPPVISDSLIR